MTKLEMIDKINKEVWSDDVSLSTVVDIFTFYLNQMDDKLVEKILKECENMERNF